MRSPCMLFRPGSETIIWDIHLDTIIVDEHEVPDYLASGWYSHPFEARDSVGAAVRLETVSVSSEHSAPRSEHNEASSEHKPRRGRPPKTKE